MIRCFDDNSPTKTAKNTPVDNFVVCINLRTYCRNWIGDKRRTFVLLNISIYCLLRFRRSQPVKNNRKKSFEQNKIYYMNRFLSTIHEIFLKVISQKVARIKILFFDRSDVSTIVQAHEVLTRHVKITTY